MDTYNNLPLYTMGVDDSTEHPNGVSAVALVDRPAIKRGFLAFRTEAPAPQAFQVTDEDRRIVSGPLMLADTPIYRKDKSGEYYVISPAPEIEKIVRRFMAQGNQRNVNLMHDPAQQVDGVVMFESFISDASRGIAPMRGHEDAPQGSWFGSFFVNNEEVWQAIKSGEFTGFSVEGIFAMTVPKGSPLATAAADDDLDFAAAAGEMLALLKNC